MIPAILPSFRASAIRIPNRSHFRSTEIWQTASDSDRVEKYGWLGRYFDNACAGADPTVGVVVGRQLPESFFAKTPKGICFDNPQNYRFLSPEHPKPGQTDMTEAAYEKLNEPGMVSSDDPETDNSGASIGSLPAGMPMQGGKAVDFIERTALDAQLSSEEVRAIAASVAKSAATYPASQLGNSLKLVAKLIGGGLPTRIYYVSQGGYDTHTNQIAHATAAAGRSRRFAQGVRGGHEGAGQFAARAGDDVQ